MSGPTAVISNADQTIADKGFSNLTAPSIEVDRTETLFTVEELAEWNARYRALDDRMQDRTSGYTYAEKEALNHELSREKTSRVMIRAEEFLEGLIVMIDRRGGRIPFRALFGYTEEDDFQEELQKADTPENRLILHTILKALTEVPGNWATSAMTRFIWGSGEQGKDKYGKYYGHKKLGEDSGLGLRKADLTQILTGIMGERGGEYAEVLVTYADVEQSIIEEENAGNDDIPYDARHKATSTEKNTEFINCLVGMLEDRGLAEFPETKEKKKSTRKPVQFKSAETILRRSNLRDMPLPAEIEIGVVEEKAEAKIRMVITELRTGEVACMKVLKDGETAVPYRSNLAKDRLYGAKFIGEWKGDTDNSMSAVMPYVREYQERSKG